MATRRKRIKARYRGSCGACSAAIAAGDFVYSAESYGWICARCAGTVAPVMPTPAQVLTKVTRDMVLKSSLSLTNSQAEVLVHTALALAPGVVPVRRPLQKPPAEGRWFNGVTGWDPSKWMLDWTPEEIIGYVLDALEDKRNTNLNKGAVLRLLQFMETETGRSFFFDARPLESEDGYYLTRVSPRELVEFRDDEPPLDCVNRVEDQQHGDS